METGLFGIETENRVCQCVSPRVTWRTVTAPELFEAPPDAADTVSVEKRNKRVSKHIGLWDSKLHLASCLDPDADKHKTMGNSDNNNVKNCGGCVICD